MKLSKRFVPPLLAVLSCGQFKLAIVGPSWSVIFFRGVVMVAYKLWRSEGLNSIRSSKPRQTALLPSRRLAELSTTLERFPTSIPTKELTFPVLPPAPICVLARCRCQESTMITSKSREIFLPIPQGRRQIQRSHMVQDGGRSFLECAHSLCYIQRNLLAQKQRERTSTYLCL